MAPENQGDIADGNGSPFDMRTELGRIARTVVVDLDGTLMTPPRPIIDADGDLRTDGEPEPGAVEAMRTLHAAGWRIVVSSSRTWDRWGPRRLVWIDQIRAWLERYAIPFDEVFIGAGKPAASCLHRRPGHPLRAQLARYRGRARDARGAVGRAVAGGQDRPLRSTRHAALNPSGSWPGPPRG